ncbi:hypothetical protein Ppa06_68210 [Planomonospora parontospora subsp. parontospora]|uniref:Uncharacterized protein n=2 Tax=Planomonospora parontospora TaxID=58119 RepID=A0AA37F8M6_9ACTN|nr:hypothetical protein GCM10010126_69060 [Planomonospora parontospora]GII13023.1 hypothetical protein Ppa06_68210 [Planomonospora parontospora subsp. parontospora]
MNTRCADRHGGWDPEAFPGLRWRAGTARRGFVKGVKEDSSGTDEAGKGECSLLSTFNL